MKKRTLGQNLQLFLMCSYAYYIRYDSLIEDSEYDSITRHLHDHWDEFDHQHKHLVDKGDLKAGTLYKMSAEDYPMMVRQATEIWMREKFQREEVDGNKPKGETP